MALITLSDIQAVKPLSSNMNSAKKVDTFIEEAEQFDIRPILGDEFFLDFEADFPTFPNPSKMYDELWNGSTYIHGTRTFQNPGLKIVLIYYSYGRIIIEANNHATAFGMVNKLNEDSERVSEKTISRQSGQAVSGAKAFETRVVDFLIRNSEDFPLYRCINDDGKTGGLRISAVRKDSIHKKHHNHHDHDHHDHHHHGGHH